MGGLVSPLITRGRGPCSFTRIPRQGIKTYNKVIFLMPATSGSSRRGRASISEKPVNPKEWYELPGIPTRVEDSRRLWQEAEVPPIQHQPGVCP